MEINEDELGCLAQALDFSEHGVEGILQCRHEGAALEVQDRHRRQPGPLEDGAPLPWRSGRIVQRPNEPALAFEQSHDFLLVPQMIATGNDVHARSEDLLRRIHRDTRTASRILPVSHHQAQAMLLPQLRDKLLDRAPARLPYDVRDEQQLHDNTVTPERPRANPFPPPLRRGPPRPRPPPQRAPPSQGGQKGDYPPTKSKIGPFGGL